MSIATVEAERSHTPKGRRARDRIVAVAETLLATTGFHGTSMRDVAKAADLPLATVVYHFARKEQLYASVLGAIGSGLVGELDAAIASAPTLRDQLAAWARAIVGWTRREPGRVRLVLRELLDNPARVGRAAQLPLAPVLEKSAALIAAANAAGITRVEQPELAVLHVVGATSYVVAAWPTVERIVGAPRARSLLDSYERDAIALVHTLLGLSEGAPRESRPATPARPPRPRPPRGAYHRRRRRADHARRRRVHR